MASLVSILDESAQAYPDKVALRFAGSSFTYAELRGRVDQVAGMLAGLGVQKGDRVAIIAPNSSATLEVLFACARLGAVFEQINVRFSEQVIKRLLERSKPRVVFVSSERLGALEEHIGAGHDGSTMVVLGYGPVESASRCDALVYEDALGSAEPVAATRSIAPSDPALLLYTSGTTGMPKGVLLSHGALMTRISIDIGEMRFTHDDVLLCELPLFHVTFVSTLVTIALGGELVIAQSHKPADIAADLNRFGATRTALVPFLMRGLAEHVEEQGIALNTLDLIIYGGEPVAPELLLRCQEAIPCDYLQGYGMTETTAAIAMLLPEHHRDPRLLSTAGTPVAGMEIRVIDEEGTELAAGQNGEIIVRSDTLMTGYFCDPERTAEAMRDGWYRTGDIGHFDEEGFLTLVDRKDNMVITGGENVYPLEVARCIKDMGDDIKDVVVMGVPDERWGETLVALVVRGAGAAVTEEEIAAHCARQLGGYKKPRIVRFVDDLGRNASGKVPREQLENLRHQL